MLYYIFVIAIVVYVAESQESNVDKHFNVPNFENAINSMYFVDKTLMIEKFIHNIDGPHDFVTAPQNFGKTFNQQMLKHFLEIQVDENGLEITNKTQTKNFKLFTATKIYKERPEIFKRHFGRYPVIYIDYSPLKSVSCYENMLEQMKEVILNTFRRHRYLLRVNELWIDDLDILEFKEYVIGRLNIHLTKVAVQRSFIFLAHVLERHFKRQPIALIDDFDGIITAIFSHDPKDINAILALFHEIHAPLLKTYEPIVRKLFCVGTLPTSRIGFSHAGRDLRDCLFSLKHEYSLFYGITNQDLTDLFGKFNYDERVKNLFEIGIDSFYSCYTQLGTNESLYNTFSIVSYLRNQNGGDEYALRSYWTKTEIYLPILKLLHRTDIQVLVNNFLQDRSALVPKDFRYFSKDCIIHLTNLIYMHNDESIKNLIELFLKLLIHLGYFTYVESDTPNKILLVCIPNVEANFELENMLRESVIRHYDFHWKTVDNINYQIDNISATACCDRQIQGLTNDLYTLFSQSDYDEENEYNFPLTLLSLFRGEFKHDTLSATLNENCTTDITLRNSNNVTFFIVTKLRHRKSKITPSEMKNITEKRLLEMTNNASKYNNDVDIKFRDHILYMSICLGIMELKDRNSNIIFSLTYSKNMTSGDNITATTTFINSDV